jgi:hypothetical protein
MLGTGFPLFTFRRKRNNIITKPPTITMNPPNTPPAKPRKLFGYTTIEEYRAAVLGAKGLIATSHQPERSKSYDPAVFEKPVVGSIAPNELSNQKG